MLQNTNYAVLKEFLTLILGTILRQNLRTSYRKSLLNSDVVKDVTVHQETLNHSNKWNNWSWIKPFINALTVIRLYTVEPRYKEVGYNKTLL